MPVLFLASIVVFPFSVYLNFSPYCSPDLSFAYLTVCCLLTHTRYLISTMLAAAKKTKKKKPMPHLLSPKGFLHHHPSHHFNHFWFFLCCACMRLNLVCTKKTKLICCTSSLYTSKARHKVHSSAATFSKGSPHVTLSVIFPSLVPIRFVGCVIRLWSIAVLDSPGSPASWPFFNFLSWANGSLSDFCCRPMYHFRRKRQQTTTGASAAVVTQHFAFFFLWVQKYVHTMPRIDKCCSLSALTEPIVYVTKHGLSM